MNKDKVKEFIDLAITSNTVAVMVISHASDGFKSVMLTGSQYDLDQESEASSVSEFLSKHDWNNRSKVPEGLTSDQQVEWIKTQYKPCPKDG